MATDLSQSATFLGGASNAAKKTQRQTSAIAGIFGVLRHDVRLCGHADAISVSIEDQSVVLRGKLPTEQLKSMLIGAVRQAGIVWRIRNEVKVVG